MGVNFHIPLRIIYLLGQMSSFKFFLGGFLLRKKQAFQGCAIASFLRYASELASPALTILATVCKIKYSKLNLLYITSNFHFKGNIFLSPAKPVNSFHLPLEINVIALETPVCHIR